MLKRYTVAEATETILDRNRYRDRGYPAALLARTAALFGEGATPETAVAHILGDIRVRGEVALAHWSTVLDGGAPNPVAIGADVLAHAWSATPQPLQAALQLSVKRIRAFHALQPLPNWETTSLGGRLGQRTTAIDRVGVYVPGGTAPLPSSLLMSVIPAQVAGVPEVVVVTPPNPSPVILAAAHLCGVPAVYQAGGAQAIAALAYGTSSIPKVDKIVGAGNLFVNLAKQQLYGQVGLDGMAGPTETMVVADETANPAWVAADLLAQAEHDVLASAILLTNSERLAAAVDNEVIRQLAQLSRREIAVASLAGQGGVVLTASLDEAYALANDYAPEHLCISVSDTDAALGRLRHAGGLFVGEHSFEVLGDYVAGPSHVMPTGGTARFASPLNVLDFVKITSIVALDDKTSARLADAARQLAEAETLTAHAASAAQRLA